LISLAVLPAIAPPDAPMVPGWWPMPPGWWLLGTALFLLSVWLLITLLQRMASRRRHYRQPDIRVMALAALDELERREAAGERETAYRLNEILRAALLDPRASGKWRPFTPRSDVGVDKVEWQAFWVELDMRYRPLAESGKDEGRRQRWLTVARKWLERLPEPDDMRA
jgi:Domain of unknown function (DUF4381)